MTEGGICSRHNKTYDCVLPSSNVYEIDTLNENWKDLCMKVEVEAVRLAERPEGA